jgi:dolichol-phosphate mannosyltransferase
MTVTLARAPATTALTVVLPAYNESRNLPRLLTRIGDVLDRLGQPYEVVVVDDGSTDDTASIAESAVRRMPVRVIRHRTNRGLGGALLTGLLEAIPRSGIVITMDADDTQDPDLIPRMVERIEAGHDVVIASRFESGGAEIGVPLHRRFLSHAASAVLKRIAPIKGVRDYSCGYRAYRSDCLRHLVDEHGEKGLVQERGFACMLEVLLKVGSNGARIAEVPLVLRYDRKKGHSAMQIVRTIRRYRSVVQAHRVRYRPVRPRPQIVPLEKRRSSEVAHRILSLLVAAVGLLLAAPLMVAIALLVRLTSPGPVLYKQVRVGYDRRRGQANGGRRGRRGSDTGGKPFTIYKFRTMYLSDGDGSEEAWTAPDDPRVTPVGRVLRQMRLDEMPQLFNVLRGEMNMVGPRPEQPTIFGELRTSIDGYAHRQAVPPGITGLAQVRHHYGQSMEDVRRKLRFDLEYISERSIVADCRILLRTVPTVLLRRGAW